jgi:hypothetical protein
VTIAFEGPDARAAVDVFSDPISSFVFRGGFSTFGLSTETGPSPENPAELRLRVSAQGFVPTSVPLRVAREGTTPAVVRLVPDNPTTSAPGTAGTRSRATLQGNGTTDREIALSTAPTRSGSDAAQASATIPAGTRVFAPDGTPLQGRITADVTVYDNSLDAQRLLPQEALVVDGARQVISGALRIQIRDENGRVAGQLETPDGSPLSIPVQLPSAVDNPSIRLVDFATGETRTVGTQSGATAAALGPAYVSQPRPVATRKSNHFDVGTLLGLGTGHGVANAIGFGIVLTPRGSSQCDPGGRLTLAPNRQAGTVKVSFSGNGFAGERTLSLASDTTISGTEFGQKLPDVGPVTVVVTRLADGGVLDSTSIDWCSETKTLPLPAPDRSLINATIQVDPACPAGQRVPLSGNFDAYDINFRPSGFPAEFESAFGNITVFFTDDPKQTLDYAELEVFNVVPGDPYSFHTAFGAELDGGEKTITMPSTDGGEVTFTDTELTDLCE